jgi:hypothetical protein
MRPDLTRNERQEPQDNLRFFSEQKYLRNSASQLSLEANVDCMTLAQATKDAGTIGCG